MRYARIVGSCVGLATVVAVGIAAGPEDALAASTSSIQITKNVEALATSKNPKAVWTGFSGQQKEEVRREFADATVSISVTNADQGSASVAKGAKKSYSGCWSRAVEATFVGGLTKRKMFGVGQRTQVCVKKGKVKSVRVISPYKVEYGRIGFTVKEPTTGTYNASWEGRGVARVDAILGISLPGVGDIGARKTICAKLYLNGNGHDVRTTGECHA